MSDPEYPKSVNKIKFLKGSDPFQTVYFFDARYHVVKDGWLKEISSDEAEAMLRTKEFALWNMGNPAPGNLPDSCPEVVFSTIPLDCSPELFLANLFDIKYKESILNNVTKN